jgi:predicted PurR-regulated permease PerM
MEDMILKSLLNFGVFPAITIYLVFVIIKDFKGDIENLKNNTISYNQQVTQQYKELNDNLSELLKINEQMQNIMMSYLNDIIVKLIKNMDDNKGGD